MPYIRSPVDNCEIWYELVDDPPEEQRQEKADAEAEAEAAATTTTTTADDDESATRRRIDDKEGQSAPPKRKRKRPRLVFIMGMGATSGCWGPQVDALARAGVRAQALLLDNRGVGKSGTPKSKKSYSTATMARDVLACMDAVGWESAHLVGHSMGGMIAVKLASAAPKRVESLTIISATAGGIQIVPTAPRAIAYTLQLFFARSPAARAAVDLKLHFAPSTLDIHDATGGATRRELLHEEYVEGAKGGGAVGQSRQGFLGQLRAVWKHRVTRDDVALVRRSPFPVLVLHGRSDLLAPPKRGAALAARLGGAYVELEGAHFLTRERGPEVNALVRSVVGGDLAGSSSGIANGDDDDTWCGGWAVPDPHRDLVPKQGWWRHRIKNQVMNLHLRGSMTRLSSALSGAAGGSMAALSAAASNAAAAAAAAMSTTTTAAANGGAGGGAAAVEREIATALSTPLVIDDANNDNDNDNAAAAAGARPASPSPSPSPSPPAQHDDYYYSQSSAPLRYASSPEPWGAAAAAAGATRDRHSPSPFPASYEGAPGTLEWISAPGVDVGLGGRCIGDDEGDDDDRRRHHHHRHCDSGDEDEASLSREAVVVKGAADPFASSFSQQHQQQQEMRHRRHNRHLSFMTQRCSTAEVEAGTPPPPSLSTTTTTLPPPPPLSAFSSPARKPSDKDDGNHHLRNRSPSPGAEPPMTPPSASRGNGSGGGGGGESVVGNGIPPPPSSSSAKINGRSSFAFAKRGGKKRDVTMSDDSFGEHDGEDDVNEEEGEEEEDPRRNNSRCPFVDAVACSLTYRDGDDDD